MSERSTKNREYLDLAGVARLLTESLLTYKRVSRRLPGADQITEKQFAEAERHLGELLDLLIAGLGEVQPDLPPAIGELAERIRERQGSELLYFQQDLAKVRGNLVAGRRLSDGELRVVEGVSAQTDQEAARAFRSLWVR